MYHKALFLTKCCIVAPDFFGDIHYYLCRYIGFKYYKCGCSKSNHVLQSEEFVYLIVIWTHCISDEFKRYARQKSEYSYVFRRQGEEEKKAANKLQVCDYNNGNYKTKAEWSIIHRRVQWTKLSVWCSKLFLQTLLDWNCASVLSGKFYTFTY